MIDIIIPAYNAHKTIKKTLISIALQSIKEELSVYIINDASDYDYAKEVELFKDKINIKELKMKINKGAGGARQYGVEHSHNPYIVFIDADDMFANYFSLENLYKTMIIDNNDLAMGAIIEKNGDTQNLIAEHMGCLHGKMYSREYIENYNFRFNNTRSSEDHAFNRLYVLSNPKIGQTEDEIYVYRKNEGSLTDQYMNDAEYLKWYIYNAVWTVKEAEKRKFLKEDIAYTIFSALCYTYFEYLNNTNFENRKKIIGYAKPIMKYYNIYKRFIDESEKTSLYKYYGEMYYNIPKISLEGFLRKIENYNNRRKYDRYNNTSL